MCVCACVCMDLMKRKDGTDEAKGCFCGGKMREREQLASSLPDDELRPRQSSERASSLDAPSPLHSSPLDPSRDVDD